MKNWGKKKKVQKMRKGWKYLVKEPSLVRFLVCFHSATLLVLLLLLSAPPTPTTTTGSPSGCSVVSVDPVGLQQLHLATGSPLAAAAEPQQESASSCHLRPLLFSFYLLIDFTPRCSTGLQLKCHSGLC